MNQSVGLTVWVSQSPMEHFPLTYPLPSVETVILNVGVARVWTLIAVDPVDASGK